MIHEFEKAWGVGGLQDALEFYFESQKGPEGPPLGPKMLNLLDLKSSIELINDLIETNKIRLEGPYLY